jgi:hypothetical protein|tara:strand:- start:181 stop:759 length:579 start_codon:yes stop_codon:yes gene_type:complete
MPRKSIAPWSERVAEGLIDQPIDSTITASQTLRATVDTGFIDQTGTWKGVVSSDSRFDITQTDVGIANSAQFITPSANADGTWPLDMSGYSSVFVAFKPTNGGSYAMSAIMGTGSFANLTPVNAGTTMRGLHAPQEKSFDEFFVDSAETFTVDVWNIFYIANVLSNQKLLQFKIVNNSGDVSTIESAFMRLV